ncbi:hypothetical protein JCM18237_19150 [Halorubrum luteum]
MYRVLLAIDEDERRALAQANAIADIPAVNDEITVHLCHVFRDNPEGASVNQLSAVRRARERLEAAGVDTVHAEASGDPAEEILALADEIDANVICLSGRKRTPAGKAVFGSVTQAVIRGSDRPVLAVPREMESASAE